LTKKPCKESDSSDSESSESCDDSNCEDIIEFKCEICNKKGNFKDGAYVCA